MNIIKSKILWLVVLMLLSWAGYEYWQSGQTTGVVNGHIYNLTARLNGRVQVLVKDGQAVKAGELLIQFDEAVYLIALAEAKANHETVKTGTSPSLANPLAASQAQKAAEEGIRQKMQVTRQAETAAKQDLEFRSMEHAKALLAVRGLEASNRPVSPTALNKARLAELNAKDALNTAQSTFNTYSRVRTAADQELVSYRGELSKLAALSPEAKGQYLALYSAKLSQAEENLKACQVTAPVDGQVVLVGIANETDAQVGQLLVSLVPSAAKDMWITAYVTPSQAHKLSVGLSCAVTFPELSSLKVTGTIQSIQDAEASRLAAEVAGKNKTLSNQGSGSMAINITLSDYNPETMPALRLGLPATVSF